MRRADLDRVVEALDSPVQRFVREARVRLALLVNHSGQVLAQHGFTGRYEVVNVASLAAAAHAAAGALGELTGAGRWTHLHHAGRTQELVLAPLDTPAEQLVLAAIFDGDSSLGLVQLFIDRLAEEVAALPELAGSPGVGRAAGGTDQASFERDLEAGLERLFSADPSAGE